MQWEVLEADMVHVVPLADQKSHDLSADCWCKPDVDDDGVVVHNALDRREMYEAMQVGKAS